jgi:hypothetical protein
MKWLHLVLSLTFFVPCCAVLGAFSTLDTGKPLWFGVSLGVAFGVFFGMAFGGVRGGIIGLAYPPSNERRQPNDD